MPKDKLIYFWWAYLKSSLFLNQIPTGSGGTRPRVSIDNLEKIPINVPSLKEREKIDNSLIEIAKQSWMNFMNCRKIIKQTNSLDERYA